MAAMRIALPPKVAANFADPAVLAGLLAFLSVLLRLWATSGELVLAGISYALDWKGAMRGGSMTNVSITDDAVGGESRPGHARA
jgi:hypothetical protein